MSKEVKRYSYGYVDDGNGNRYLGLIEKPDGNLVKRDDYESLLAERDALAIRIYNSGYMAGHHDTVEGQFTDIHRSDMATYHAEEVSELIAALQGEQP